MKKIFANRFIQYGLFLTGGLFLGWLVFHSPQNNLEKPGLASSKTTHSIWTCSMHPQIRMEEPGKCPLCGMDLIPLNQNIATVDPEAIHLTKEAAALANVLTSKVTVQKPLNEVRLYGKVQADERLIQNQVAHIPGRIEKLLVNFTGERVSQGQTLALVYSPELVTAQQELLEAIKTKQTQPEIYEAAKERLRQWKLTEPQIEGIESSGTVQNNFEVVSGSTGIVAARRVNNGDYITPGTVLYDIVDLSRVWVMFDAYESDISLLKINDKINFTVQALPGTQFAGNILFIDPVMDPVTRVSKVRVEVSNPSGQLKPEMFATGLVSTDLSAYAMSVVIPRTAVLWTGKRSIVYVKLTGTDEPAFKMREIELGPYLGDSYIVSSGLSKGEEIVTQGAFSVDAAAQLEGKPSMMSHTSEPASSLQEMDMPSTHPASHGESMKETNHPSNQTVSFKVSGNCDMCKERIETAAKSVDGVSTATWDADTKMLGITYDPSKTEILKVETAVALVGHDTERVKADDETYQSLPGCCKYDRLEGKK